MQVATSITDLFVFLSRQGSFFAPCHSCRDFESMSRPFFLPILSQLIFYLQQFPINSSSFSGRDLESVSLLSSGPSYFVFVVVAQT